MRAHTVERAKTVNSLPLKTSTHPLSSVLASPQLSYALHAFLEESEWYM
jgi:hypothetical protein